MPPAATIQELFAQALQLHRAGKLKEADQLYHQILSRHPDHADALHNRALIAIACKRSDIAIPLLQRAILVRPSSAANFNAMGNAYVSEGKPDAAIAAYRRALELDGGFAEACSNLGKALKDKGELSAAIQAYRQALQLRPALFQALNNLGNALKEAGELDEASEVLERAIAMKPDSCDALVNYGHLLGLRGELTKAIAVYERALAIDPEYFEGYLQLGNTWQRLGDSDRAIAAYQRALGMRPNHAGLMSNLAAALTTVARFDEAIAMCRRAIEADGCLGAAHNNLGNALRRRGQVDESLTAYRKAIELGSDSADACSNLATALKDNGQIDEAIDLYRRAVSLAPDQADLHSNLLLGLHYQPGTTAREIGEEARRWNDRHARHLKRPEPLSYPNSPGPDRRLRIGYVSADYYQSVCAHFILPLLASHDRERFELFCYADVIRPDAITHRMQPLADHWRNVVPLSDPQLAQQIQQDQIDVLVDLKVHTERNRLLVFARRPAPVQISWLGYPGTTGLQTIDYRLTDQYLDPPGMDESVYSEKCYRLPDCFWCYDPLEEREVHLNALPALSLQHFTFGCLNSFCKINDAVISLWARILKEVPASRLLLLADAGGHRQTTGRRFAELGVDASRIEFIPRGARRHYMLAYHRIDLGLDCFPYNGHTTSFDSMWMGVPLITMPGETAVSRAGWSQLNNIGLAELCAGSPELYVQLGVSWAKDREKLSKLRGELRGRMERSALMDARRFAANVEAAYRVAWGEWCGRRR